MSKTDEDLSQEWAISIHAARKIVKKAAAITKKAEKRKSEPLITSIHPNGDELLNHHQENGGFTLAPSTPSRHNRASSNPTLKHIPEEKQSPKYGQPLIQKHSFSNQTKLSLTIKNDTFMGRLSVMCYTSHSFVITHTPTRLASQMVDGRTL